MPPWADNWDEFVLQAMDWVVEDATSEGQDLASFTRILRSHAPRDLVEVEVLREGNPLRFTVVLGDRADRR